MGARADSLARRDPPAGSEWAVRPTPGAPDGAARPLPPDSGRAHAGFTAPPPGRRPACSAKREEIRTYEEDPAYAGARPRVAGRLGGPGGRIGGHPETGPAARPVQPGRRPWISLEQSPGQARDLLHLRGRQRGRHRYALDSLEP